MLWSDRVGSDKDLLLRAKDLEKHYNKVHSTRNRSLQIQTN